MDKQTLYFENPPNRSGTKYEWTNIPGLAGAKNGNNESYLYMPSYMTREFGHTAGLSHSSRPSNIMSGLIQSQVMGLTGNDEKAMKNLYNNNHHATN